MIINKHKQNPMPKETKQIYVISVVCLIAVGLAIWALIKSYHVANIAQGIQGVKGDPGFEGDSGVKGDPEVKGDQGVKGDPGSKGDQGETGPIDMYIDGTADLTFLEPSTVKGSYFYYNSTTGVIFFHAKISVSVAQMYSIGNINQWGGDTARWT